MSNNNLTPRTLLIMVENAFQFLQNNDIDLFFDVLAKINTQIDVKSEDNILMLKLINEITSLVELIEYKKDILAQNIKSTRVQIKARQTYLSQN
ncbi:MAG: hypothetical protein AB7V32_05130 [Candidatus Berkiella sp.]